MGKEICVKKPRQVNIEVLRIVAMLMIISLHYLGKGSTLFPYQLEGFRVNGYISWTLEALSYVAVNIYILISGYFLVDSKFRFDKVIRIWLQVFFYSAGIYLLFRTIGILPDAYNTTYFKTMFFAPLVMKHNWYPSIYIILYLLVPFLSVLVKQLSKRQLQACIVVLLLIFSKIPTIFFPSAEGFDDSGYGIIWMICLFVVAAYIKLYVPITGKWGKKFICYVVCSIVTVVSYFAIFIFYMKVGKGGNFTMILYAYNSPTTIVASIALFLAFLNMGQNKNVNVKERNTFFGKATIYIASLTFGIYLIHEHMLLRDLWVTLWKVPEVFGRKYFIFHFVGVVLTVFIACGVIEAMRQWIFKFLFRSKGYGWIIKKTEKIDMRMNGEAENKDA